MNSKSAVVGKKTLENLTKGQLVLLKQSQDEVISRAPKHLRWLAAMLRTPKSVRQLHRATGTEKKLLRGALVHLASVGVLERRKLRGGGHEWFLSDSTAVASLAPFKEHGVLAEEATDAS